MSEAEGTAEVTTKRYRAGLISINPPLLLVRILSENTYF